MSFRQRPKRDHYTSYYRRGKKKHNNVNTIEVEFTEKRVENDIEKNSDNNQEKNIVDNNNSTTQSDKNDASMSLSSYTISSYKNDLSEVQTDSLNYIQIKHIEIPYLPNIYDDETLEISRNINISKRLFYKEISQQLINLFPANTTNALTSNDSSNTIPKNTEINTYTNNINTNTNSNDINTTNNNINTTNNNTNSSINSLYCIITYIVRKGLSKVPRRVNFFVDLYGSRASGLALPDSDLDILVSYIDCDSVNYSTNSHYDYYTNDTSNFSMKDNLTYISNDSFKESFEYINNIGDIIFDEVLNSVNESCMFQNIYALPNASVPVIKLEYEFPNSNSGIKSIKVDMSFQNLRSIQINPNIMPTPPSIQIIQYIKQSIEYLPNLKPAILFFKRLLRSLNLNNYYKGGLSSYSLVLLILAFFKYKVNKATNITNIYKGYLGTFIIQCLTFYANFPANTYAVDLNRHMPFYVRDKGNNNIFNNNDNNSEYKEKCEKTCENNNDRSLLVIHDPITYINVSSGTFLWEEIQSKFQEVFNKFLDYYNKNYKKYCIYINNYYNDTYEEFNLGINNINAYLKNEDFEFNCLNNYHDDDNIIEDILKDIH